MFCTMISLFFLLSTSFVLAVTDTPVDVTDTVTKLYDECFEIFLHVTMFLHGNISITEIPSQMLRPASFCLNKYAHLPCQQGFSEGYVSTQQDSASSFQGDITYESIMNWRNFTDGSLTYQEAYCMIRVITIMMNQTQVNLCSVLSICSAALNSTQCETTYGDLLMALQENCHLSSRDCECEMVYTYKNSYIVSTVAATLFGIVALLAGGTLLYFKYFKKTNQSCKCWQYPQPHRLLPLRTPPQNIPAGQQIYTIPGSHHNRDNHRAIQLHNFRQEFRSPAIELTSFINQNQEYNCSEVSSDSDYEICHFKESISEQQNQNRMKYMVGTASGIPEYLEILPDLPSYSDLEISDDHDNQQQVGSDDLEHKYAVVGEKVLSVQLDSQEEASGKKMRMVNEKFQKPIQEINLENLVAKGTNVEESDGLDESSSFEGLPFKQEVQDGEHVQNMGSNLSLFDELVEIVIESANRLFSENGPEIAPLEIPRNFSQMQRDSDAE